MEKIARPENEQELLQRCRDIASKTLGELASRYQQALPSSLTKSKGFMGQLLETILGATALNQSEPDFQHLGIELKTIPLNANGLPRESTYVCTAPISVKSSKEQWENSRVRNKLKRVLWVPIEADPMIPLGERRIGNALLWSLDPITELILRQDWEELTQMLQLGQTARLSARMGTYLQIRPKAAHSRILSPGVNEQGEDVMINPRGFYLRTILTEKILSAHYSVPV